MDLYSTATRLKLYREMLRIRLVEERIAERYPEGAMKCPVHLSIGQEATAVGVCHNLNREDVIFSTHRNHAHYLAKGGDLKAMIAEMYGKATGCCAGKGGSMHLIDVDRGMYGSSAIVGGSTPLPVGVALYFQFNKLPHVSVAFFGDAVVESGIWHECMNFAALKMLPVIFMCEDNDYSTMSRRYERQPTPIAERAVGYGMQGTLVDGNNVLAVAEVAQLAVERARYNGGPSLIVAQTYRWREHVEHNTSIMKRPDAEVAMWKLRCPLKALQDRLVERGITDRQFDDMRAEIADEIDQAYRFAEESPVPKVAELFTHVGGEPAVVLGPEPPAGDRKLAMTEAIAEATVQAMEQDPQVLVMGLHVTDANGIFGTTAPAFKRFGPTRVIETPVSEAALTGVAGGAAMMGMKPIHVHARNDFTLLIMAQLGNELTTWPYTSGGRLRACMVIRALIGRSRGQGVEHAKSLQVLFAHFPGLNVVAPATAYDAKGLLLTALAGRNPVIFLEHRLCHPLKDAVPVELYLVPFGKSKVVRPGKDVTIVALMQMVYEATKAADELARSGIEAEVIDLRSVKPWDKEAVCSSVRKTGRLIVADTGWTEFGISAEIVSAVTEQEFSDLKAPPQRIGLPACPTPCAEILENAYYPGAAEIVDAARRLLGHEHVEVEREVACATPSITTPF